MQTFISILSAALLMLNAAQSTDATQETKNAAILKAQQAITATTDSLLASVPMDKLIYASPTESYPPLMITFTQPEHRFDIDFGDGTSVSNAPYLVAHKYTTAGIYVVSWYRTHTGASVCVNDCLSGASLRITSITILSDTKIPERSTTTPALHQ